MLHLTVQLQVVSWDQTYGNPQLLHETDPYSGCEPWASAAGYIFRDIEISENITEQKRHELKGSGHCRRQDQLQGFGELINDCQN